MENTVLETLNDSVITNSGNLLTRTLAKSADLIKKNPIATAAVATGVIGTGIYFGYRRYRRLQDASVVAVQTPLEQLKAEVAARRAAAALAETEYVVNGGKLEELTGQ